MRVATVLLLEGARGVFEEAVGELGELPHKGDEGDLGGFAVGAQALIERAQDGVAARGDQGGHVKGGACQRSALSSERWRW